MQGIEKTGSAEALPVYKMAPSEDFALFNPKGGSTIS